MFDILMSGDAFVPDHGAAVHRAALELGLRTPDERRFTRNPRQRIEWSVSRIHRDRRVAPTLLEFLATLPPEDGWSPDAEYDAVPEIGAAQGDRPARLHSTPVGVQDVLALVDRLRRLGVTHRLAEPSEHYSFPRLWVGHDPDRPGIHDARSDGGTYLEFLPTSVLGVPEPGPAEVGPLEAGTAVRILARTLIVDDLDATVDLYERNFGWEPAAPPTRGTDGVARARFQPSYPRGAAIELIEPDPSARCYEAEFAGAHGPGAFGIRFAVHDLGAARERLSSLGVTHVEAAEVDGDGPRLIRPAEYELGAAFELVEWDGS